MSRNPLDLGCLRLFESAARHENLSRAAAELGMTQPALSYRIRQMEQRLGRPLFERRHRGLALSPAGRRLQRAVVAGLAELDAAVAEIAGRPAAVRLSTDYAFAALWLMPRVAAIRGADPGTAIEIVAAQELHAGLRADSDLAVLFGGSGDVGQQALALMPERVAAVCSPGFLAAHGPFEAPEALAAAPLLHLAPVPGEERPRWYDWDSWLAGLGARRRVGAAGLMLNTYTLVIQAALAGQGLALGWLGLVDELLESGALVRAHPATLQSERGYWLLPGQAGGAAGPVAAWIRAACGAGAGEPGA